MSMPCKTYFRLVAEGQLNDSTTRVLAPVLKAASFLYGRVNAITRSLYEKRILKPKRLPIPVVSIGNLTWGGSGKTPLVEYVARRITERGKKALILTRGYGQDEVQQMKHNLPETVIAEGKNRYAAGCAALKKQPAHAAILDDGFQHWPLARDLEIVVVNALDPFGSGQLIPAGILREPLTTLSRASFVVVSHANLIKAAELEALKIRLRAAAPKAELVETCLEPLFFYKAEKKIRIPLQKLRNTRVTTLSGVAAPKSFQLLLKNCDIKPTRNFEFTDHHDYSESELQEIKRVSQSAAVEDIITTEKDFYRCPEKMTRILNPLILAARLRVLSGEGRLIERISRLLEAFGTNAAMPPGQQPGGHGRPDLRSGAAIAPGQQPGGHGRPDLRSGTGMTHGQPGL